MSLPGFAVKIKRPISIKVRFTEANGNVRTEKFTGLTARYFQQAVDYLDGISFTERAHPVHKEQAKKTTRAGSKRVDPNVVVERLYKDFPEDMEALKND